MVCTYPSQMFLFKLKKKQNISSLLSFSQNWMPFPFLPLLLLELVRLAKTGSWQCQSVECEWNLHRKTL